jgi:hypothetical protein
MPTQWLRLASLLPAGLAQVLCSIQMIQQVRIFKSRFPLPRKRLWLMINNREHRTFFNGDNARQPIPTDIFLQTSHPSNRLSGRLSASIRASTSSRYSWRDIRASFHSTSARPNDTIEDTIYQHHDTIDRSISPITYSEKEAAVDIFEKGHDSESGADAFVDRCKWARTVTIFGLLMVALLAFAAFSFGLHIVYVQQSPPTPDFLKGKTVYMGLNEQDWYADDEPYNIGHWACCISKASAVLVPLLLNVLLTAAFHVMGCIDAAVLKWGLWLTSTNDMSVFNSNPRLVTFLKGHAPLSWYSNMLSGTALVFAYGATAVLTTEIDIIGLTDVSRLPTEAKPFKGPHYGLDFNGWALLVIGISLFVRFFLTTWNILWSPALVKTWSTNPLMCGRVAYQHPRGKRRQAETKHQLHVYRSCLAFMFRKREEASMTRHLSRETTLTPPFLPHDDQDQDQDTRAIDRINNAENVQQPSLHNASKPVRHLKIALWLLATISIVAVITISIVASRSGSTNGQFIYNSSLSTSIASYWQNYGLVYFPFVENFYSGRLDPIIDERPWLGILIQSLFQAPVTLALHCASLILDLNRDECTWRRASSKGGVRVAMNPFLDIALNWLAWIFFLYKAVLQWIFGYAIYSSQLIVGISLIPLVTLTGLLFLLGIVAEILTRWKPKGTLPTTWGNIGLLAQYIGPLKGDYIYWDSEKQKLTAGPKR